MEDYKMSEIKHPTEITYFIAYTDTLIFGYGIVTPEQTMTSGQPLLYTTLIEADWLNELLTVFNTDPYFVEEEEEEEEEVEIEYTP